jgi:hypothetical protein
MPTSSRPARGRSTLLQLLFQQPAKKIGAQGAVLLVFALSSAFWRLFRSTSLQNATALAKGHRTDDTDSATKQLEAVNEHFPVL